MSTLPTLGKKQYPTVILQILLDFSHDPFSWNHVRSVKTNKN